MEKKSLVFLYSPVLLLLQKLVSISDQKVNILDDVETCLIHSLSITPFKEWTHIKCNKLNMKVKDRVVWK